MKKTVVAVVLAFSAFTLFASSSVGLSIGLNSLSGKAEADSSSADNEYATKGFYVGIYGDSDISNDLSIYTSFGATFPRKLELGSSVIKLSEIKDEIEEFESSVPGSKGSVALFDLRYDLGVAKIFRLYVGMPMTVKLGAGLATHMATFNYKLEVDAGNYSEMTFRLKNYGLNLHADASCAITRKLSAFACLSPSIMFINDISYEQASVLNYVGSPEEDSNSGLQFGFQFLASLGVKYSF